MEKCYGVSQGRKNDCAGAAHACAGQSKMDAGARLHFAAIGHLRAVVGRNPDDQVTFKLNVDPSVNGMNDDVYDPVGDPETPTVRALCRLAPASACRPAPLAGGVGMADDRVVRSP